MPNFPCGLWPRSITIPSKWECAVLPLNSRKRVRPGQVFLLISVPSNAPVGCCGNANQKPIWSDPAATLPLYLLSGLVIQNVETVLSDGIRICFDFCPSVD